jgi:EAL domain-containing protein (putative c-di-GMP-specific phosphodiesterase class I)/CheY-like chemotaxis protein
MKESVVQLESMSFLVVEDHEFQRNILVRILEGMNARAVHTAPDGRVALELLKKLRASVDVIISDLDMPSMDGMEFIRHVGAGRFGTSLIVASAVEQGVLSAVESMASAYGINFLGTIEKPVTRAKLLERLERHMPAPCAGAPVGSTTASTFTLAEIMDGLADNQFEPFFQPKVDVASRKVVGAEALARWCHPQQGVVPPSAFVKTLEDSGHVDLLMRQMLAKGAAFCHALCDSGYVCRIAVNVSIKSLVDVHVAEQITEIVRGQGIEPSSIVLEITESAATTDIGKVLENLARLRMKGFELSIDDYGTGYSSLEQLARIPFKELKIDKSFVTNAARYEASKVILESSLEMARRLSLRAVAEGVETLADWELLRYLRCDVAQGYFIAKPLSAKAYLAWLQKWNAGDAMEEAPAAAEQTPVPH